MKEHSFTPIIKQVLAADFLNFGENILQSSQLLQYVNVKTVSATRGSKARASFANLYAIYVLIEDYIGRGYHMGGDYKDAEGAKFTKLLQRQRELPFGSKLQNHALNHRVNEEFKKYFPTLEYVPILRDPQTKEYWINENLLKIKIEGQEFNISESVIKILDAYMEVKQGAFNAFIADCQRLQTLSQDNPKEVKAYLLSLLRPNVDARIFEIVSFSILKTYYSDMTIYWGWNPDDLDEETLTLYKTGRTNANDGGIDFVMRPLGRFFQVTESLDVRKYFLDIEKIQKYPVTFVVKSERDIESIREALQAQAEAQFPVSRIIERYMGSIEEIINISILMERLEVVIELEKLSEVMEEIVTHSRVEFNIQG